MSDGSASFSIGRVLLIAIPCALVAWFAKAYTGNIAEDAQRKSDEIIISQMLGRQTEAAELADAYQDEDDDLLPDAPEDAAALLDPNELVFSYVASTSAEDDPQAVWGELLAALSDTLGRSVTYVRFTDTSEQLRALRDGELHITAFGTGAAPGAVNEAGFIPFACFANEDGKYGYTMKLIVPADSELREVADLTEIGDAKKRRVTFTRPRSNSGFKAALVLLMEDYNLRPERDYRWGWSYGHENSINGVADGTFQLASVASDLLDRHIAAGKVEADKIRTIYESKTYPPGVFGYAYNLTPELRNRIREALINFDWAGTGLEESFGATGASRFVAISYKDDWEPVRHVNRMLRNARAKIETEGL